MSRFAGGIDWGFSAGRPVDRGTDRRIQGGLLAVRQGRGRHHHHQRTGHGDEVPGAEPDGGGATGHDQRGGRGRYVCD